MGNASGAKAHHNTQRQILMFLGSIASICVVGFLVYYFLPSSRLERRIREEINTKWPPASKPIAAQLDSINKALASLDKTAMPRADAYLGISKATLQEVVPPLVKAQFPELRDISIRPARQEVISEVTFELKNEKPPATVKGTALIHITAIIKNGAWTLTPIASEVKLRSVKLKGLPEFSVMVPLINSVLANFIQNLSSQVVKESSDKISFSLYEADP